MGFVVRNDETHNTKPSLETPDQNIPRLAFLEPSILAAPAQAQTYCRRPERETERGRSFERNGVGHASFKGHETHRLEAPSESPLPIPNPTHCLHPGVLGGPGPARARADPASKDPGGRGPSPLAEPGRRDRSVRGWVPGEDPQGHDGAPGLRGGRRGHPSLLLPQPPLHRRQLPHVPRRGREVPQARRLLRHARSSRLVRLPLFNFFAFGASFGSDE